MREFGFLVNYIRFIIGEIMAHQTQIAQRFGVCNYYVRNSRQNRVNNDQHQIYTLHLKVIYGNYYMYMVMSQTNMLKDAPGYLTYHLMFPKEMYLLLMMLYILMPMRLSATLHNLTFTKRSEAVI